MTPFHGVVEGAKQGAPVHREPNQRRGAAPERQGKHVPQAQLQQSRLAVLIDRKPHATQPESVLLAMIDEVDEVDEVGETAERLKARGAFASAGPDALG